MAPEFESLKIKVAGKDQEAESLKKEIEESQDTLAAITSQLRIKEHYIEEI